MSRSQYRKSNSVSLFPFLAVLVCAMGALLFLLIVTTHRIRKDTIARAAQERAEHKLLDAENEPISVPIAPEPEFRVPPEPEPEPAIVEAIPEPVDPNVELRDRIAQLTAARDEQRRDSESQAKTLRAANSHINDDEADLTKLDSDIEQVQQQQQAILKAKTRSERNGKLISSEVTRQQKRLRSLLNQPPPSDSRYALIPYDGVTGTTRKPILIECTGSGIRFIPENIMLTAADLNGFTAGYNPLLAGTKSLIRYWSMRSRLARPDEREPEPYVLLVVRPSGSLTYYAARKMLDALNDVSGYELIEEGLDLALPDADAQAVEICRESIDELLQERNDMVESIIGTGRIVAPKKINNRGLRFRRSGTGGFIAEDETEDSLDGGRRGSLVGGSDSNSPQHTGTASGSGTSEDTAAAEEWERVITGNDSAQSAFPKQKPFGDHGASRSSSGSAGRVASNPLQTGQRPGVGNPQSAGSFSKDANKRTASHSTGDHGAKREWTGRLEADAFRNPGGNVMELSPQTARPGDGGEETGIDDRSRQGEAQTASGEHQGGNKNADRTGSYQTGRDAARAESNGAPSASGRASASTPRDARQSKNSGGGGDPSSTSGPNPSSASQPNMPAWPPLGQRARLQNQFSGKRPADMRWGLSSRRAGIGFERAITVDIGADRIVIGDQKPISVGRGETRDELTARVLKSIDDHARSWGEPPKDFYWVPSLTYVVAPGGNLHLERLREPLGRWGLKSTTTYTLKSKRAVRSSRK